MPSSLWLLHNGHQSLRTAIQLHGGQRVVSRRLGVPIRRYYEAQDGHYASSTYELQVDNLLHVYAVPHEREPQIAKGDRRRGDFLVGETYIECHGTDPRRKDARSSEYVLRFRHKLELYRRLDKCIVVLYPSDFEHNCAGVQRKLRELIEAHGRKHPVSTEIDNAILPATQWATWGVFRKRVHQMIEANGGEFPTAREAERLGFSTVYFYASRYHGGIARVKGRLGLPVRKMGRRYWANFANVKQHFLPVCKHLGRFPTAIEIRQGKYGLIDCVSALYAYYEGGLTEVATRLGYPMTGPRRSVWDDIDYFYGHLYTVVRQARSNGYKGFPTAQYLRSVGAHALLSKIYGLYGHAAPRGQKMTTVKRELFRRYPELAEGAQG